jgi:integrase/recombinase XerD
MSTSWEEMHSCVGKFIDFLISEKNSTKNTVSSYISDLSNFFVFVNSKKNISKSFNSEYLKSYALYLSLDLKLSSSSIARKLSCLRQFLKFLYSENLLIKDYSVEIELPKKQKKIPKFLTVDEISKLFDCAKSDQSFQGQRFNLMLNIAYGSGLRVSELVSLKKSAVSYKNKNQLNEYIIIYGKGGKERLVPLNQLCLNYIKSYLTIFQSTIFKSSKYLFPSDSKDGYISRQRFGQQLKEVAEVQGIDSARVSPHILRHSLATHILSAGADLRIVQEILGHTTISTTEIYTHILNKDLHNLLVSKHPLENFLKKC